MKISFPRTIQRPATEPGAWHGVGFERRAPAPWAGCRLRMDAAFMAMRWAGLADAVKGGGHPRPSFAPRPCRAQGWGHDQAEPSHSGRGRTCGRLGGLWADLLATAGQSRWPPLGKINWPLTGSVVTKTTTGQKDDLMSIQGRRSHEDQDCRRKYDEGDGR